MSTFTEVDAKWMAIALKLAQRGRFSTSPNPNVGCVVVDKHGQLLGQGYHQKAGQAHAEVNALLDAGFTAHTNHSSSLTKNNSINTKGATVYVTLEPCSHVGKTPPCANALIEAQVARVVIASIDNNPLVMNKGVQLLRNAGIQVDTGLMEAEAVKLNTGFNYRMTHQRPWVTVKLATSLDGKTALANGESKWITGPEARANVQVERAQCCAILSGADTVIADNPQLNVRIDELPEVERALFLQRAAQPIRIIIDGQNRLHEDYQLFQDGYPVIVFNAQVNQKLQSNHIQQIQVATVTSQLQPKAEPRQYLDLHVIMQILAEKQINKVWTETGAALSGALLSANLVNELIIYQAPKLLGNAGRGALDIGELTSLEQAVNTQITDLTKVGNDLKLRLSIKS